MSIRKPNYITGGNNTANKNGELTKLTVFLKVDKLFH